jgi:predicted ATPase
MQVRELTLRNFRVFSRVQTFTFSDQFSIVAGVNGRGKTAILDGLALLLSRLLKSLDLADGYRSMIQSETHGNRPTADLSMKLLFEKVPVNYWAKYNRLRNNLETLNIPLQLREEILGGVGDQSPLAVYYTTDRAGYRLPRSIPRSLPSGPKIANSGALIDRMVDYRDFIARYRVWSRDPKKKRTVRALNRVVAIFLDGFSDVKIARSSRHLTVRKGSQRLSLDQLSDGERSFLAILSDLVRRLSLANPDLNDPLEGTGVVLIDELELHLHPKWQREVVEKLRTAFPHIQFIATTHSPFIIQSLRPGELINLDPEEFAEYSDKSVEDIAENVMGIRLPQKSERYLDMVEVAEKYFKLVKDATPQSEAEAEALRVELDELTEPYSDDPAYTALLRLERETKLEGGDI